jgi:hypothetical protein
MPARPPPRIAVIVARPMMRSQMGVVDASLNCS